MYWYKSPLSCVLLCCIVLALLAGCKSGPQSQASPKYFDVEGYFTAESARLAAINPMVTKTATHNGVTETQKLKIANWAEEFALFKDADINKPAWTNSYKVINEGGLLIYRAKEDQLQVHEILIKREQQKIKWILIYTRAPKNILYKSYTKLSYFPDSLYMIEMDQHVKLLGVNTYKISGLIAK